jgi:hypothetical protein
MLYGVAKWAVIELRFDQRRALSGHMSWQPIGSRPKDGLADAGALMASLFEMATSFEL